MADDQNQPIDQITHIERVRKIVSTVNLGDALSKLTDEGWTIARTERGPTDTTIIAERETPPMPATATKPPPPTTIGARLREAREAAGITGRQVAAAAMMAPSFVSDFENDRREPDLDTIWRYCLAVGVDPSEVDDRLATVTPDEIAGRLAKARERQVQRQEELKKRRGKKS